MPKLWNETIQAHRRDVRDAILDTTAGLVAEHGLLSVTMRQIAEATGIGRATLYKYFPDVETTLLAWHDRQLTAYVEQLRSVRDQARGAQERLEAVLGAYARLALEVHGQHDTDLLALLHEVHHRGGHGAHDGHSAGPRQELGDMLRDLLADAAAAGVVRDDVAPGELVVYCLHALAGSRDLRSDAAVRRLVTVTLAGLRPQD